MVRALLVRGMLAGLLAGVLGFVFAHQVGEASVDTAIAFESYVEYDVHHEAPEVELVGRDLQSTAGLGTGTLIYGIGLGGLFGLVFAAVYGRLGGLAARATAAVLGLLGFIAVYLVPFLKYPANPPAVGDQVTIQYRTAVYLLLVLVSVAMMVFAVALQRRLMVRFGGWNATLLAAGVYILAMAVCYAVLPDDQRGAARRAAERHRRRHARRRDVPAHRPVVVPRRLARSAGRGVGDYRAGIWRPGRAPSRTTGARGTARARAGRGPSELTRAALHADAAARGAALHLRHVDDQRAARFVGLVLLLDVLDHVPHAGADFGVRLDVADALDDERRAGIRIAVEQRDVRVLGDGRGHAARLLAHPDRQLRRAVDLHAAAQRQVRLAVLVDVRHGHRRVVAQRAVDQAAGGIGNGVRLLCRRLRHDLLVDGRNLAVAVEREGQMHFARRCAHGWERGVDASLVAL